MQAPIESVLSRSWQLLTRNWIIIVPGIVIGLVVGIIDDILAPPATYGDPATTGVAVAHAVGGVVSSLIAVVVGIAGFVATQCYTVGMAGAAWERGRTTLADGAAALRDDATNVLTTAFGTLVLGFLAALLALPTLFVSVIVFYLFLLFAIPAAIVGNRRGFSAIGESISIARHRFLTVLIIGIVIGVIAALGTGISLVFAFAPLLGPIVAAIISQIVVAFSSLVLVGEYLNLRGTAAPATW